MLGCRVETEDGIVHVIPFEPYRAHLLTRLRDVAVVDTVRIAFQQSIADSRDRAHRVDQTHDRDRDVAFMMEGHSDHVGVPGMDLIKSGFEIRQEPLDVIPYVSG